MLLVIMGCGALHPERRADDVIGKSAAEENTCSPELPLQEVDAFRSDSEEAATTTSEAKHGSPNHEAPVPPQAVEVSKSDVAEAVAVIAEVAPLTLENGTAVAPPENELAAAEHRVPDSKVSGLGLDETEDAAARSITPLTPKTSEKLVSSNTTAPQAVPQSSEAEASSLTAITLPPKLPPLLPHAILRSTAPGISENSVSHGVASATLLPMLPNAILRTAGTEADKLSLLSPASRSSPPRLLLPSGAIPQKHQTLRQNGICALHGKEYERAIAFTVNVPVLRSLSKAQIPLIVQAMKKLQYDRGEILIQQGTLNDQLFIVLSGEAEVVRTEGGNERVLVKSLVSGDYFGEQELLHAGVANATVRATGTQLLTILSIAHAAVRELDLCKFLRIPKRRACVDFRTLRKELGGSPQHQRVPSKSDDDLRLLRIALRDNRYIPTFCSLTESLIDELVERAARRVVPSGEVVMREGELHSGRMFFIVKEGAFHVQGQGRRGSVRELPGSWEAYVKTGESFGELELLHSAPCLATVIAVEPSVVWVIDHSDFIRVLESALDARLKGYVDALRNVPFFSGLFNDELRALSEAVTEVTFTRGEDAITQGECGDTFFVLTEGSATVLVDGTEVRQLNASRTRCCADFFGEEELLRPGPRIATVRITSETARALALDKISFDLILKPLDELLNEVSLVSPSGKKRPSLVCPSGKHWFTNSTVPICDSVAEIRQEDLELQGVIGSGGFGTVELAVHKQTGDKYALKRLRRASLSGKWARQQVLAEKRILLMTDSPFVIKLHKTFRDPHVLAFLLEFAPEGDILNAFCRHELFGNSTCVRFYAAGIVGALEHLHERHILHRDVKPDNVLLQRGWPKLSDFGLAKFCVGKTFTVCGTQNYLAPETILQIGQCAGVDWWAFGVFVYEMMAGHTPFESTAGEDIETYKAIKRGIPDHTRWCWPTGFDKPLQSLMTSLLRHRVSERLPIGAGGIARLRKHLWFNDFDWVAFEARELDLPDSKLHAVLEFAGLEPSTRYGDGVELDFESDWATDF